MIREGTTPFDHATAAGIIPYAEVQQILLNEKNHLQNALLSIKAQRLSLMHDNGSSRSGIQPVRIELPDFL